MNSCHPCRPLALASLPATGPRPPLRCARPCAARAPLLALRCAHELALRAPCAAGSPLRRRRLARGGFLTQSIPISLTVPRPHALALCARPCLLALRAVSRAARTCAARALRCWLALALRAPRPCLCFQPSSAIDETAPFHGRGYMRATKGGGCLEGDEGRRVFGGGGMLRKVQRWRCKEF